MIPRDTFKLIIVEYSAYYQTPLDDITLRMYVEDFIESGIPIEEISSAFRAYRRNPKNNRMPIPAAIIDLCRPKVSDEAVADSVSLKILKAHARYGTEWNQGVYFGGQHQFPGAGQHFENFPEAILAELGELGLAVVSNFGGWKRIGTYLDETTESTALAQLRRIVESTMLLARTGTLKALPKLPTLDRPALEANPEGVVKPQDATLRVNGQDIVRSLSERMRTRIGGPGVGIEIAPPPDPKDG